MAKNAQLRNAPSFWATDPRDNRHRLRTVEPLDYQAITTITPTVQAGWLRQVTAGDWEARCAPAPCLPLAQDVRLHT